MRRIIYGISLWVFLAATACTIASTALPNWISYTSPTSTDTIRVTYGLYKRCSSISGKCTEFPLYDDCQGDDQSFCSMWKSAGFLMNFTLVLELATVVAYLTIMVGGRSSREAGWKVLASMLGIVTMSQLIAMALVVRPPYLSPAERTHLTIHRLTCTTTITASLLAGNLTNLGSCALSAGPSFW